MGLLSETLPRTAERTSVEVRGSNANFLQFEAGITQRQALLVRN